MSPTITAHDDADVLRNHATAAGAEHWLDDLPRIEQDLEEEWDITVGRLLAGATEAYVAEATTKRRATGGGESH